MAKTNAYQPRFYRETMGNDRWRSFRVSHRETDLWVAVDTESYSRGVESFVRDRVIFYRGVLDDHISRHPAFLHSLVPVKAPAGVHPLVRDMSRAARAAGTGPMSAVAGAMAHFITNDIIGSFNAHEVIIENGGDIFMVLSSPATLSVYAGTSPLSEKTGVAIKPEETPLSVCCSSGTIGHSLSFGVADACMIACRSGALADAYATAFCNMVKDKESVQTVTEKASEKEDILSVVIIKDDIAGFAGSLEIRFLHKA